MKTLMLTLALPAILCHAGVQFHPAAATGIEHGVVTTTLTLTHDGDLVGFQLDLRFDADLLTPLAADAPNLTLDAEAVVSGRWRLILVPTDNPPPALNTTLQLNLSFTVTDTLPASTLDTSLEVAAAVPVDALADLLDVDALGTASIHLRRDNTAPIAETLTFAGAEDTILNGTLNGSDVDNDLLTYRLENTPAKGVLTLTQADSGQFTYVPLPDAEGMDSFTYRAFDGRDLSQPAVVTISLAGSPDPPRATSLQATVAEDQTAQLTPEVDDPDEADSFTFALVTLPEHVSLTPNAAGFLMTPEADWHGTADFEYQVTDSDGFAVTGQAHLVVTAVNDAPTLDIADLTTDEDTPLTTDITITDPDDHDQHVLSLIIAPSHGSVTFPALDQLRYTPSAEFSGTDHFTLRATDPGYQVGEALVQVQIDPVNDPPTATGVLLETCADLPGQAAPEVSDVDLSREGDSFTFTLLTEPANGVATVTDGQLRYQPDPGFSGEDLFEFRATDSGGLFIDGEALVIVAPFNRVTASPDQAQGLSPLTLQADTNCGRDLLTFTWVRQSDQEVLAATPELLLDPPPGQTTAYLVRVTHDITAETLEAAVRILVHPLGPDLNQDGVNDARDLWLGAASWPFGPEYDADGDGETHVTDLLYITVGQVTP